MSMKRKASYLSVLLVLSFTLFSGALFADVAPLVQSMWGTGDSWNDDCPNDNAGDGNNVDAGTMAVSMAMVMKYWNHPANGLGSNSYIHPVYGLIDADFENTFFRWESMSNTLILNGTKELIYHTGVALSTDYGIDNSYALITDAYSAFVNNFRYDTSLQIVSRSDFSDFDWEQMLKNELNEGRPVLYKADDIGGQVGFVIDGWQNGNEFHVNWGKDGNENGFFTLNTLAYDGADLSGGHTAVLGIYPSLGPNTVDENFEGDFSGFNWQFTGDSDWAITTNEHYYGIQSAKSGQVNHNQSTSLFIEIDVTADDVISFNRKVSCENSFGTPSYDYLSFWIDDQEMDRWDGQTNWSYEEYPVTAGVHNFRWTYQKDGATVEGQDCAWVDAIDFPNGDTPLNPVENFYAQVVESNNVLLSWDAPILTTRNLIGYRVYRNGVELITVSNPNVFSYTDSNLPNDEYTYYVKAFYQQGLLNPSNPYTIEIEVPYSPTNLIAEVVSDDDVALSWTRPPSFRDGRELSGFRVYRNDTFITDIPNVLTTSYDDLNLTQAVYRYVVTAIYNVGESNPSNVAIASIGVPTPPTGLTAQIVNSNDIQLDWLAPAGTRELVGYKVYRDDVEIAQLDNTSALTYTDTNLANGNYTYDVTGLYSNGESEAGTSAIINLEVLYAPVNLSYTFENQVNVRLTWDDNALTNSVNTYAIYRNGQQIAAVFNPNRHYYLDEDLPNGVYDYYVTASYATGTSDPSTTLPVLMEILYPCTVLDASVVGDDITLTWDMPVNSGGLRSFNGYNIYRNGSLSHFVNGSTVLTYTDNNLANGFYDYEVTASYTTGESTPVSVSGLFVEVLYPPRNLTVQQNDDDFTLNWLAPANSASELARTSNNTRSMNGFKVYRDDVMIAEINDPAVLTYQDNSLANGFYNYYVTALHTSGESGHSNEVMIEMDNVYPPTALLAVVNQDTVDLSWTAPVTSGGLTRAFNTYRIYRDGAVITETTQLNYSDIGLANGSYDYYVTAVYDSGESTATNTESVIVEVLYPATGLVSSVYDRNNISLAWTQPVNIGGLRDLLTYKIYRNDVEIAEQTEMTYNDLLLANGTYNYNVKVVYTSGMSAASNITSKVIEYPYPVTNLATSVVQDDVTITWDLPTRSITQLQLFRGGTEIAMITDGTATQYVDENLANGTYTYYLITHNDSDSGPSDPSADVTATVEVLYPARNLMANVVADAVNLSWTEPATTGGLRNTERDLLSYKVFRNDVEIDEVTTLSYDDIALTNGNYDYYVKAVYTSGIAEPSNTESVLVEVLYPATGLTASVDQDDVTLNWVAPVTSGGLTRAFLGYKIYRDNTEIADITATTYVDSDLTNGVYDYYVEAQYSTGISAATPTVQAVVEVLYPPTGLTGQVVQDNNVQLNWIAPVITGGLRDFVQYRVVRNGTVITTTTNLDYYDVLIADGAYSYVVEAVYDSGISQPSNTVSFNIEFPYPATNLVGSTNDDDIILTWDAPSATRVILGYRVFKANAELAVTTETTYTDAGLANGVYEYFVKAIYAARDSDPTNTVSVTLEVLYPALNLIGSVNDDDVSLSWDIPNVAGGITRNLLGYKIYRDDVEINQVTETTYDDLNLANAIYNYYVKAVYDSGISAATDTLPILVEVLYPASNLTYSVDQDEVTLNWDAAATSGGLNRAFLGYKVYRDDVEIADVMELTFTDVDLTNGTYSYYVKANYGSGLSEATNSVTPLVEVLYPATNLTYSVDQDEVTLMWDAAVTSGGLTRAFLGYKVYRDDVEIADLMELTLTDVDLTNGTYNYYVKANYTMGLSEASNTVTPLVEVLYPAANLTYSVDQDEVTLMWDAAATSGGLTRAFLGYKVYRDDVEIADLMALTYTDVDLANGYYGYYVKANYTSGLSEATNTVTPLVEVLYPASNLTYSVDQDNVTLSWDAAATSGGLTRAFLGYKVYRDDVEIADLMELTYTDADLANGIYEYYVKANYSTGISEASNTVIATIELLYPASNLTYSVDQDEVTLMWDAAATSGGLTRAFLGYKVYRDDVEVADLMELTFTDVDLANGFYNYYVKANYTSGLSEATNTVTPLVEVLYPATNLTYSVDQDEVTLMWDAAATSGGLTRAFLGYKVYRDDVEIADLMELTFTDVDLANGLYDYYVVANYTTGMSEPTSAVTALVEVLYPASNLTLSVDQDEVTLMWDAAVTTGGLTRAFLGYKIYRDNLELAEVTTLNYTDVDLTNGSYDYYVKAAYDNGLSTPTNTITAIVEVLYPASNLSYVVSNDQVVLSWDAAVTTGGLTRDFLGYKVYRDDVEIAETNNTSYTDPALANGTYSYYVKANYTSGLSEPTNTVFATIEVLYPAMNLTASVTSNEVTLMWDVPAVSGGLTRNLISYKIYRDLTEIAEVTELSYTDLGLSNGDYSYYVKVVYDSGISAESNTVNVTIEVLYPVTGLTAVADANAVQLDWVQPISNDSRSLLGYNVYRDDVQIAQLVGLSYNDANLANGTYSYYVVAYYTTGDAVPSNLAAATVEVPYAPSNLTGFVTADVVTLNWDLPAISGGLTRSFNGYFIYRDDQLIHVLNDASAVSYDDANLANADYEYYISAVYDAGISANSNTIMLTVNVVPDLFPPTNLTVAVNNLRDVTLNWDAPTGNPIAYKVYREATEIAEIAGLTYNDLNLPNGSYTYWVKAVYNEGISSNSNSVVANIEVAYAPTNLTATVNYDDVDLAWDAPANMETGFIVYRENIEIALINDPTVVTYTDMDLMNGSYSYQVKAVYPTTISNASIAAVATVEIIYPVSNFNLGVNNSDVYLTWDSPADATGLLEYNVYRDNLLLSVESSNSYTDMGLMNGTYDYYVTAVYTNGESNPSQTLAALVDVTYPPQNVELTLDGNDVTITWDAPVDVTGLVQYNLFRNGTGIGNTQQLSYVDLDLLNGYYTYSVTAQYSSGSLPAETTPGIIVLLTDVPTGLIASANANDVVLSWNAPANAVGLQTYNIYKDDNLIDSTTLTSYTDPDLSNGNYQYFVSAVYTVSDVTVESNPSNVVDAIITLAYEPTNLGYTIENDNDVVLTWNAPSDMVSFTHFNVYKDNVLVTAVTELTYTDSDLMNGSYDYYVEAEYSGGLIATSSTVTATIEVIYEPTALQITITDDDAMLTWSAPVDLGGFASYNVFRGGMSIANVTTPAYDDLELANGVYSYTVTAVYGAGESATTTPVEATVEVAYSPETAEAYVQPDSHFAIVNWTSPVDDGLLIGYNVFRLIDGEQANSAVWTEVQTLIAVTSYLDEDFTTLPAGNYLYAVEAEYESGATSGVTFTNVIDPTSDDNDVVTPFVTALNGNYPNPFNPQTTISFSLAKNSHVDVVIFNNRGQIVKRVVGDDLQAGTHTVIWNGIDKNGNATPSGIYFIRMVSETYSKTVKAVLMK